MKYQKDVDYYNDLYDKITVSACRMYEINPEKAKTYTPVQLSATIYINNLYLKNKMSERALKKDETIKEWIQEDKRKDEYMESQFPPKTRCLECYDFMELKFKEYIWNEEWKNDRVMFIFECESCKKRRAIYNDWEEYVIKKDLCIKCWTELICKNKKKKDSIITNKRCSKCSWTDEEVLDLHIKDEIDPDFEKDRARFCIPYNDALRYKEEMDNIKRFVDNFDEVMNKDKRKEELKDDLANIKKLKFKEIEKLLNEELSKIWYTGFYFSTPVLWNDIKVEYTVFTEISDENDHDILKVFKDKLKELLLDTNWTETNDWKPEYKLWAIRWKLRWVDSEEDIIKLIEKRRDKNN